MEYLPCIEVNPDKDAEAAVVWLHGLGATGYGIKEIIMTSQPNLYSSAGLSDESYQYVFAFAEYERPHQRGDSEDIETLLVTLKELDQIMKEQPPMSARTWPVCHMYLQLRELPGKE